MDRIQIEAVRRRERELWEIQRKREAERQRQAGGQLSGLNGVQMTSMEEQLALLTEQQRVMRENQEILIQENRHLKFDLEKCAYDVDAGFTLISQGDEDARRQICHESSNCGDITEEKE